MGHAYIYLACKCGHETEGVTTRMPRLLDAGGQLSLPALERLRCSACGRVGRPETVRVGWTLEE